MDQPSYATIDKVTIRTDKSGVDLDVTLHPSGKKTNVRLGWAYEGNGFGLYVLPEVGDEVVVIFPGGDVNSGVAVCRLTNKIDQIPDEVGSDKILLVGKSGHNLDITINGDTSMKVTGDTNIDTDGATEVKSSGNTTVKSTGGNTNVEANGTANVKATSVILGSGTGDEQELATASLHTWLLTHVHQGVSAGAANSGVPVGLPPDDALTTATKAN